MKLKLDYVTNSSSTSFCVWGVVLSYEEAKSFDGDKYEEMWSYLDEKGFRYGETNGMAFGISPRMMKPDQTLNEFKKEVIEILKLLGLNVTREQIEYIETEVLC